MGATGHSAVFGTVARVSTDDIAADAFRYHRPHFAGGHDVEELLKALRRHRSSLRVRR